jgi:hypothetical protein
MTTVGLQVMLRARRANDAWVWSDLDSGSMLPGRFKYAAGFHLKSNLGAHSAKMTVPSPKVETNSSSSWRRHLQVHNYFRIDAAGPNLEAVSLPATR